MRFHRPMPDLASSFPPSDGASFHAVVVDALARILLEADGALMLLDEEEASRFLWLEPHLRKVFDEINSVLFRVTEEPARSTNMVADGRGTPRTGVDASISGTIMTATVQLRDGVR